MGVEPVYFVFRPRILEQLDWKRHILAMVILINFIAMRYADIKDDSRLDLICLTVIRS